MDRFVALDSFRGVCAVMVVLFHTQILQSFSEFKVFRGADLFVEFFFVLSGFVLYHSYGRRPFDAEVFRRFVISRSFRIYPLHLCMLLIFIGLEFGKLFAQQLGLSFNEAAFTGKTAPVEILPNALLLQSWIAPFESLSFNTPAWSISVEFYLYLLLGLALLSLPRYSKWIFALLALLAFSELLTSTDPMKAFVWRGMACFFAGVLTYQLYEAVRKTLEGFENRLSFTLLEVLCLFLMYGVLVNDSLYRGVFAGVLFCWVVLVFALSRGALSSLMQARPLQRLGELSYSIYLTHTAVIFLFTSAAILMSKVTGHEFTVLLERAGGEGIMRYITTGHWLSDSVLTVLEVALVVALSWGTYRFVELKGIALGKRLVQTRPVQVSNV